jgi:hypothetical protein
MDSRSCGKGLCPKSHSGKGNETLRCPFALFRASAQGEDKKVLLKQSYGEDNRGLDYAFLINL